MICPRCSQTIQPTPTNHCPQCGQPLYAPQGLEPRVIKLGTEPEPEATPAAHSFDSAIWPALDTSLNNPPDTSLESDLESGQRIPLVPFDDMPTGSQQSPSGAFEPTEWQTSPIAFLPTEKLDQPLDTVGRPVRAQANKRLMIVLALIVALALVTGGTMLLANGHTTTNAPQIARTHPTATAIPTATATATPRPTATATAIPTATATPAPHLVTLFSDALTSNTHNWPNQNGCSFQSGGYEVSGGAWCFAPVPAQADTVNISVQVTFAQGTYSSAGIGFRIQNDQTDQSYVFFINPSGYCYAADRAGNNFFATSCQSVNSGGANTLTINQNGAHMDFYVNGTLVGSANDGTFGSGGIALATQGRHSDAIFSNFTLTQWQ